MLITGASSGIGRAVAEQCSLLGARCIICGRDAEKLNTVCSALNGAGHIVFSKDLSVADTAESIVSEAVELTGPIAGFAHCAGIEKTLPFRSTELADFRELMTVNVESYWNILQELLKKRNYVSNKLSVVSVSSVAALYGAPGKSAYAASKGALISLTKSLAAEYSKQGIRFNCICPGYVATPMLEHVKKLYKTEETFKEAIVSKHVLGLGGADDVALAAVYLLSGASKWVTGSVMNIDGGYSVR